MWRGNNSTLLVFNNGNIGYIVKYSNGEFESSILLPLDYIKKSLNIEKKLQGRQKNKLYFNEKFSQDEVLVMKDVLMMFGLETNEDGSISTNLDVDQFYELYSKFVTPLILDYYSSIIQLMENSR